MKRLVFITICLSIVLVGYAAVCTLPPSTRAYVGEEYTHPVTACDPQDYPMHITSLLMPAGMVFDANNTMNWTPTVEQLGPHYTVFNVTNIPTDFKDPNSNVACYIFNVERRASQAPVLNAL